MFKLFSNIKNQLDKDGQNLKKTQIKSAHELYSTPKHFKFTPRERKDMERIADVIIEGNIAYVNMSKFSEKDEERFKQFITGVLYAVKGSYTIVDTKQYIFSSQIIHVEENQE